MRERACVTMCERACVTACEHVTACERTCVTEAQSIAVTTCQNEDLSASVSVSPGAVTAQGRRDQAGREAGPGSRCTRGGGTGEAEGRAAASHSLSPCAKAAGTSFPGVTGGS